MKITIYDLLGMIKDGKAPKKIMYNYCIYIYWDLGYDYRDENKNKILFRDLFMNEYDFLNDEIEIINEPKEDKIEKLNDILRVDDLEPPYDFNLQKIWCQSIKNQNKINEIIDRLNNE